MAAFSAGEVEATLRLRDQWTAEIQKVAAANKRSIDDIKGDLKAATQAVKELEAAAKEYASMPADKNPLTKMLDDAKKSQAAFRDELAKSKDELKQNNDAVKSQKQAHDDAERAVRKSIQAQRDLGVALKDVGDKLTVGVTAPLVGAGVAAVHFASEYETNITKVRTLTDASKEEVERMRLAILDLAPAVGIGPNELAKGLYSIESAGYRGQAAIEILTKSAKMSQMGMGDMETISRTLVGTLQSFKVTGLSAADAADVIAETIRKGNMPVESLAGALGRVNAIAAAVGVSFDQVGAAIATFTHEGISTAEAVTGLRAILMNLNAAAPKSVETWAQLGYSMDQVRAEISEKGLAKFLVDLMDKYGGNIDLLKKLIPNVRGLAEALAIARSNGQGYVQNQKDIADAHGVVEAGFKEVQQTMAFGWKQIAAELEDLGIKLGNELLPKLKSLLPVISDLIKNVMSLIEWFGKLPTSVQTFVESMLVIGVVGGPVLSALGRMLDMWVKIRVAILAAQTAGAAGSVAGGVAGAAGGAAGGGLLATLGGMATSGGAVLAGGAVAGGAATLAALKLLLAGGGDLQGNIQKLLSNSGGGAGLDPEILQLFNSYGPIASLGLGNDPGYVAGGPVDLRASPGPHIKTKAELQAERRAAAARAALMADIHATEAGRGTIYKPLGGGYQFENPMDSIRPYLRGNAALDKLEAGVPMTGPIKGMPLYKPQTAVRLGPLDSVLNSLASQGPGMILSALQGGGGLSGGLSSLGSMVGSTAMSSLFGSFGKGGLLNSVGGLGGKFLGAAAPMLGAMVGPGIENFIKGGQGKTMGALNGAMTGMSIGALGGPVGMAIGAGVGALAGLIRNLGGPSKQEVAGRDSEKKFEDSFGGFDQMMAAVGKAYDATGRSAAQAQADVKSLLDAEKKGPDAVQAAIDKINLAMEQEKAHAAAVQDGVDGVLQATQMFGSKAPAALQPMILKLMDMKGLTDDQKTALKALTGDSEPDFKALESMAAGYGIELSALGPKFQQAHISDAAHKIFDDFTTLTQAGADANGVLAGMADEVNDVVHNALKFGSTIPDSMKPMLQSMIDAGLLTDDTGKKIMDLSGFKFDDSQSPLQKGMSDLTNALKHLADVMADLPGKAQDAADGMNDAFRGVKPPDLGGGGRDSSADHMAVGGSGFVDKPTLFLAGEAGPEFYSFSGAYGGSGGTGGWGGGELHNYIVLDGRIAAMSVNRVNDAALRGRRKLGVA